MHLLFQLCQLPTPDTAISIHRHRERALPFLATSITVTSEHKWCIFTTVRTTPISVRTQNTTTPGDVITTACAVAAHPELTHNVTIMLLLKQQREDKRRERTRREERSDEVVKTACEEVKTAENTLSADSVTSICVTCDISSLSSGPQNLWGSIQCRNCRYRPCNLPHTPCRTYHSFQCPTSNYIYKSPSSRSPTTPPPVIKTIRHPYRIGPTKLIVRVPVSAPVVVPAHQAPLVAVKSSHSVVTIQCHCGRQGSVSKIPTISYPTFTGLILDIISFPLSFPTHFFSHFWFS